MGATKRRMIMKNNCSAKLINCLFIENKKHWVYKCSVCQEITIQKDYE